MIVFGELEKSHVTSSRFGGDPAGQWGEDTLLGPPQVTECADDPRAWASQEKNTVESVAVGYEILVEVDQRDVGDWAEIDSIQLIGYQP